MPLTGTQTAALFQVKIHQVQLHIQMLNNGMVLVGQK
jgi:hypothetical protein